MANNHLTENADVISLRTMECRARRRDHQWPGDVEGGTLVILHALQEAFGYVPEPAIPMVASALNLSRAEVHGVFTFYHDFATSPPAGTS